MPRELLKRALPNLRHLQFANDSAVERLNALIEDIEAELAKPEAEPVAWKMTHPENNPCFIESYNQKEWGERWSAEPLYTHPPCSCAATRRAIVRAAADIGRSM